jgi:Domain of unknown function (DUF4157)
MDAKFLGDQALITNGQRSMTSKMTDIERRQTAEISSSRPMSHRHADPQPSKEAELSDDRRSSGNLAVQRSLRSAAASTVDEVLHAVGRPLEPAVRTAMEARFNRDFSEVRVHTDGRVADAARALSARALTVGRDIAFAPGEYAPGSAEGTRLLAHELTHTIQQDGADRTPRRWARISEPDDPSEREADRVADEALSGRVIDPPTVSVSEALQRAPVPQKHAQPVIQIVTENIVTEEWLKIQGYRLVSGPVWPQHWVNPETHDEVWRIRQAKDTDKSPDPAPPKAPAPDTPVQGGPPGAVEAAYQAQFLAAYEAKLEKDLAELWEMQRNKDPKTKARLIEFWKDQSDLDDRLDGAKARFHEWDANTDPDQQVALDEEEQRIIQLRDRFEQKLKVTPSGDF